MLEVSELVVDHGSLRAIWDVSFRVDKGERVGLLGANGAGKSTTLGAIIGIYPSVSGRIVYNDQSIVGVQSARNVDAGISLVPEGRRLFQEMTVTENLEMGAYTRKARARLAEQLERVFSLFPELKEKRTQRANELSGGQQQMVAVGRALMTQPQVLMLDEPTAGVSPIVMDELFDRIIEIARTGITILIVEQNARQALGIADKGYVLVQGRNRYTDTGAALLANPEVRKSFLGG